MTEARPEALLLTGLYGSGKSSVAAEIAELLERRDVPYAAIDLDWLAWAKVGDGDGHGPIDNPLLLPNLTAVMGNDLAAGVTRFVLAGTVRSAAELEAMQRAVAMPMRVVRLEVPIAVIESRLGGDPTSGRANDLEVAKQAAANAEGDGLEDLAVDNDRPIGDVAAEVVRWLGWT